MFLHIKKEIQLELIYIEVIENHSSYLCAFDNMEHFSQFVE